MVGSLPGNGRQDLGDGLHVSGSPGAQSAEPARGVPSTGREKRSNITPEMNLMESLDVAMSEAIAEKQAQQKFGFSTDNPFGVTCPDPAGVNGISEGANYSWP